MDGIRLTDELLTLKEAAGLLKISDRTIRRWVASGRLDYIKISRRVYTTIESLENLSEHPRQISNRAQKAHEELAEIIGENNGFVHATTRTGSEFRS